MHKQLTEADRAVLAQLLALKVPKKEIAARLKKDRSSIYRELGRNSGRLGYIPLEAQQRAMARRRCVARGAVPGALSATPCPTQSRKTRGPAVVCAGGCAVPSHRW